MPNRQIISSRGMREIRQFVSDKKSEEMGENKSTHLFPYKELSIKKHKKKVKKSVAKKSQAVPFCKEDQIAHTTKRIALRRRTIETILDSGKYTRQEVAEIMNCTYATIISDTTEFKSLNVPLETVVMMHDMLQSGGLSHSEISEKLTIPLTTVMLLTLGIENQPVDSQKVIHIRDLYANKGISVQELIAHFTVTQHGMTKILVGLLPFKIGRTSEETIYEIRQQLVSPSFSTIIAVARQCDVSEGIVRKYGKGLLPKRKQTSEHSGNDIIISKPVKEPKKRLPFQLYV